MRQPYLNCISDEPMIPDKAQARADLFGQPVLYRDPCDAHIKLAYRVAYPADHDHP